MKKFLSILICILLLFATSCAENNTEETKKTNSTTKTEETAPKKVKVVDSKLKNIEITPASYPKSELKTENFSWIEDRTINYIDKKFTVLNGIDVSSYSGEINWEKVRESGIDFAIIRVGGRGYGESGILYEDKMARTNIENAKKAGIQVGVYFYSQAITKKEAEEEAQFVLDFLNGEELHLPVCYDFEFIENDTARTDNITGKKMTKFAKAFFSKITEAGYQAMLYGESHDFYNRYDLSEFKDFPLWYAEYSDYPNFYYSIFVWQYSSEGKVDGITGSVDLNLMFFSGS